MFYVGLWLYSLIVPTLLLYNIGFSIHFWSDISRFSKKNLKYFSILRKYEGLCYDNWMIDCVIWFNNMVYSLDRGLNILKRKQLFVYGPTMLIRVV